MLSILSMDGLPIPASSGALRLRDWWSLRLSLIWAYRGVPAARSHLEPDPAPTYFAWRLNAGRVALRTEAGEVRVKAGQWVFLLARHCRGHVFSEDAEIVSINFLAHWVAGEPVFDLRRPVVIASAVCPALDTAAEALVTAVPGFRASLNTAPPMLEIQTTLPQFLQLRMRFDRFLQVWCRIMQSVGVSMPAVHPLDPRVADAVAFLQDASFEAPPDLVRLAARQGLSVSQLNRLFLRDMGVTVRAYAQGLRLQQAKQALIRRATAVKCVAYRMGFKQASHFTAWFRRLTGYAPRDYRRRTRHPGEAL